MGEVDEMHGSQPQQRLNGNDPRKTTTKIASLGELHLCCMRLSLKMKCVWTHPTLTEKKCVLLYLSQHVEGNAHRIAHRLSSLQPMHFGQPMRSGLIYRQHMHPAHRGHRDSLTCTFVVSFQTNTKYKQRDTHCSCKRQTNLRQTLHVTVRSLKTRGAKWLAARS